MESLRQAIHNGDTIGFDGRNKFISEAANIGKDEDWIVETFLQDPDPFKYGVIERDGRENPNPSGYKLIDAFSLIDLRSDRPVGAAFVPRRPTSIFRVLNAVFYKSF